MKIFVTLFLISCTCTAYAQKKVRGENYFTVAVGDYDYLPHTGFKNGKFMGFGEAVLSAFAKSRGYTFEYKSFPIPRMLKVFLDDQTVDFIYPNNEYWGSGRQQKKNVLFSTPVTTYVDGIIVREEDKNLTLNKLTNIGMMKDFSPVQYEELIKAKKLKVYEHSDVKGLLQMVLNRRLQGVYMNPLVAAYYAKSALKTDENLVLDEKLPYISSSYHLSTIKHPRILEEFDEFLKREKTMINRLRAQYGVQDPFIKDSKKYTPPSL